MASYGELNIEESPPPCGSRNVDCFQNLEKIGEGTYGQVYMARELKTAKIVALKKLRLDMENYKKEGFPMTAIREIKILKKLQHKNVVKLKEVVTSSGPEVDEHGKSGGNKYKGSIFVVFEYMDHDLMGLSVRHGQQFTTPQIKCYMKQLLTGLHYCHANQVLHRDIKSANLLIDNEGNLKLADFGLAQSYSRDNKRNLANNVVTLPYRPPELLLGCTKYGPSVDMWSVGCVFGELLLKKIILPGRTELDQLQKISELCGSPNEVNWPGVSKLPWYEKYIKGNRQLKNRVREVFRDIDRNALELLEKLLTLDPSQRISAKDALDAEYFWADPLPCDPKSLPKYESSHEFQMEMKRQQLQYEEMAKRQKTQQHARLPPMQQSGQAHSQHWAGGHSHPVGNTSHHYSRPSGGPMCYPPRNNLNPQGGVGFNGEHYPPQVRGYGVDPATYSHNVQYGGTSGAGGRGPNVAGNRNQQYNWQQQ